MLFKFCFYFLRGPNLSDLGQFYGKEVHKPYMSSKCEVSIFSSEYSLSYKLGGYSNFPPSQKCLMVI